MVASFHPLNHRLTWRIIPVSKWLVTPIYKPFRQFGRGITPFRGLTITMVINYLQVLGWSSKRCPPFVASPVVFVCSKRANSQSNGDARWRQCAWHQLGWVVDFSIYKILEMKGFQRFLEKNMTCVCPKHSMYIYIYIYLHLPWKNQPNVGKYTIHLSICV